MPICGDLVVQRYPSRSRLVIFLGESVDIERRFHISEIEPKSEQVLVFSMDTHEIRAKCKMPYNNAIVKQRREKVGHSLSFLMLSCLERNDICNKRALTV
jgi:hypothetical protein